MIGAIGKSGSISLVDGVRAHVLKQSLIFSGLNGEELAKLSGITIERSFGPGEFVFWEGDVPDWFYIVEEGTMKVLKHFSVGKQFM